MNQIRQSFAWWCFANKGVEDSALLNGAKALGYEAVDLIGEKFWPQARDAGLRIASINGHGTIEQGLNRRENAARIEAELLVNIEKAVQWEIPILICFSGNRDGLDDQTGAAICAETLARVAPAAEKAGVTLALELLNSRVDHLDYQCDHTPWGVGVIDAVASPAVRLLYDIYHMQIMEGDIIRTIGEHHKSFAHYHTAGNPGRGPMDDNQELWYPPIYRAISATGYTGFLAHEFFPKADPLEELATAFRQCAGSL